MSATTVKTTKNLVLSTTIEELINQGFDLKAIQAALTAKKPTPKPVSDQTKSKRVWAKSIMERILGLNKSYEFIVQDIKDFGFDVLKETLTTEQLKTFSEAQVLELCKARSLKKFLKFGTPSQVAKAITPNGAIAIFQKAATMDAAKFSKVLAS